VTIMCAFIELLADENTSTGGEVEGKEIRRILTKGVDHLPERERLVVALYYFEGLTFKEIGKVLGVSESRVYQLHTQAMNRLRNFMRQEGGVGVGRCSLGEVERVHGTYNSTFGHDFRHRVDAHREDKRQGSRGSQQEVLRRRTLWSFTKQRSWHKLSPFQHV